jgi:hypothetical protein
VSEQSRAAESVGAPTSSRAEVDAPARSGSFAARSAGAGAGARAELAEPGRGAQREAGGVDQAGAAAAPLPPRVAAIDTQAVASQLDAQGWARLPGFLERAECEALAALYTAESMFRSRVVMERHGYGRGEYQYFDYPLPEPIAALRAGLYPQLAPLADRWSAALGSEVRYPAHHSEFIARCHAAGQRRPTPLLLRYGAGDYNCLHQDLYGEHMFPLQVAILLSAPERDFTGGEFVMTEQRPRMQSRPMVIPLRQGDALVFAVQQRPVQGTRGVYRVNLRHGVSRLHSGQRFTLGIIFHDAT